MKTKYIIALLAAIGFTAAAQSPNIDTVTLGWTANTESDLGGYKVYATQNTNLWTHVKSVGLVTNTTLLLPAQGTWYFTLTATNTGGLESLPSDTASYTTPVPPAKPTLLRIISATATRVSTITTATNLILLP